MHDHEGSHDNSVERREFVIRVSQKDYHKPMVEKFGERYTRYRQEWDASSSGKYLPPFPLQIDFEIIDFCNLGCIMCPRSIDRGSGTELPLEDFKKVIDEDAAGDLKAISFGGGDEPLLRKCLLEMIGYASARGIMDIRLSTNATLLTPQLSADLINSGLTYITFSLDASNPETYRKIRGGNLDKVESNVKSFLEILNSTRQTLPVTRVSFVVMPENLTEVDDFVAKWESLVDFIDLQDYIRLEPPNPIDGSFNPNDFSCYQPWQRLAITAKGEIAPCCTFQGRKLLMGNIRNTSISETWNSDKMKRLREQLTGGAPPPVCKSCYSARQNQQ